MPARKKEVGNWYRRPWAQLESSRNPHRSRPSLHRRSSWPARAKQNILPLCNRETCMAGRLAHLRHDTHSDGEIMLKAAHHFSSSTASQLLNQSLRGERRLDKLTGLEFDIAGL